MKKSYDKYAVALVNGKQYLVREGDQVLVDKITAEKVIPEVLLIKSDGGVKIGKPEVPGAKVVVKVLNQDEKGEKVDVFKYKAKSRYRKHIGFRPRFTRLLIEKIS